MKNFQTIEFDAQTYERELNEFEQLLQNNHTLTEQKQILPFFRARPFLSSRIALLVPELFKIDKIAYEFDLFGDFCCDMVIGDSDNQAYCFIEFEDAQPTSIFTTQKTKFQSEFSYRLEHGYSQIIDWFYLLNHITLINWSNVSMLQKLIFMVFLLSAEIILSNSPIFVIV